MDEVIVKCSTVIDRHSMKIQKKEHNKWIDDCYLLLGIANYYKGNFTRAEEMFGYVSKKYKAEDSRFDAALWLARTYIEQEKFGKANTVLSAIEKDNGKDRPKDFAGQLERTIAYNFLQQARYKEALPHLENASRMISEKQLKARMTYITAQTFKLENRSQMAIDNFAQVVRMKPDYEMEFYAKISQALAFDRKLDSGKIKSMLREMARAKQYETFRDQIFYALAEIEIEEENIEEGKDLLRKSANASVNNPKQKGRSYLRLADIYFIDREYLVAKNYYDSTAAFLPEDYPDYLRIIAKAAALDDLVMNLEIIDGNDSLLALANMDDDERNKKIMRIIVQLEEEAELKKQQELRALERLQSGALQSTGPRGAAGGSGKDWYFYNPNTLGVGFQEFQRNWGRRTLEDNWRRSNKRENVVQQGKPGIPVDSIVGAPAIAATPKTLEEFLATLPMNDSSQTALHNEIIDALYNVGTIYKESLFDPDNAIESFLRIANDYDTSATAPSAYYQLYRIYFQKESQGGFVGTGFRDNSDYYKDVILSDYPDSEYAKLILDPDYVTDRNKNFMAEKIAYEETYKKFSRRQYTDVLLTCNSVIQDEPNNNFLSKYYLIKALSVSAKNDADAFESILREIVAKFPDTEEGAKAAELLGALNEAKAKMARDAKNDQVADKTTASADSSSTPNAAAAPAANTSMFAMDANAEHFFALIFPKEGVAATTLKENISDFNGQKFAGDNLRITNSFIDKDRQIIIVRSFGDKAKAMAYYNSFFTDQGFLKDINDNSYQRFIITTKNFTVLFRNKNPEDYGVFFEQNYL
jgi:tetratricopeptide (TPR) repeat protein